MLTFITTCRVWHISSKSHSQFSHSQETPPSSKIIHQSFKKRERDRNQVNTSIACFLFQGAAQIRLFWSFVYNSNTTLNSAPCLPFLFLGGNGKAPVKKGRAGLPYWHDSSASDKNITSCQTAVMHLEKAQRFKLFGSFADGLGNDPVYIHTSDVVRRSSQKTGRVHQHQLMSTRFSTSAAITTQGWILGKLSGTCSSQNKVILFA